MKSARHIGVRVVVCAGAMTSSPPEMTTAKAPRVCKRSQCERNTRMRGFRNGAVERDYPSDVEERGTADRRTRNGERRVDRFRHDRRRGRTAGDERDNWVHASRWNAARQVLDDLALEAIVIVRVRGAAGDLGRVVM